MSEHAAFVDVESCTLSAEAQNSVSAYMAVCSEVYSEASSLRPVRSPATSDVRSSQQSLQITSRAPLTMPGHRDRRSTAHFLGLMFQGRRRPEDAEPPALQQRAFVAFVRYPRIQTRDRWHVLSPYFPKSGGAQSLLTRFTNTKLQGKPPWKDSCLAKARKGKASAPAAHSPGPWHRVVMQRGLLEQDRFACDTIII